MNTITNAFRIGGTRKVLLSLTNVDGKKLSKENKLKSQDGILYEIDSIPMIRYTDGVIKRDNVEIGIECPGDFDESTFVGKQFEII
jgi:hypothetical protein